MKKNEQQDILEEMQRRGLLSPSDSSGSSQKAASSSKSDFNLKFDKFKLKSDFMHLQGRLKASTDFRKLKTGNSKRATEALKKLQSKLTFGN